MTLIDPGFVMTDFLGTFVLYFGGLFGVLLGIDLAARFLRILVGWAGRAIKAN
jgi:hypothetical protein